MPTNSCLWSLKADCVLCGSHPYPRLISPPPTLKIKKKKKCLPWMTRVAPNQLHLRSKFIMSPWQHQGNKLQCLDRSWYPPPHAQTNPPPPGSFRKEVSAAAKCRVNRAGVGVAFGPHEVGSAPPPSTDQR